MGRGSSSLSKKLSDLVIMSDIDGTLLDRNGHIPKRNMEALKRFTAAGGRFAVATGRALNVARPIVKALPVNFPCVIYNGGAIYNFEREEFLYEIFLPPEAGEYFTKIWQAFPDCGVILANNDYLDLEGNARKKHSWWLSRYPATALRTVALSELYRQPAYKALLVLSERECRRLQKYVSKHTANFAGVRFVFSDVTMFEMLPRGSSKGDAIERLTDIAKVERENIVAIGDYHNDLEMLKVAGLSAAPADAHTDIKAAVDLIVGPCSDGALADLIEHLEERYCSQ